MVSNNKLKISLNPKESLMKLFTMEIEVGSRSLGLTVSPAMNLNKLTKNRNPLIRLNLYWKSIFIRPNIEWVEEAGHGSWTRN